MKILIVEDERLLADSIRDLLMEQNYKADAVYDGEAGLDYAETGIYDLIILDVMMPKMNGYQVARTLRQNHIHTPILMLTAKSELMDRVEGLDSGADYYLTKPFDARELFACVHALLRRQGTEVDTLVFGNTSLDLSSSTLICEDKSLRLSAKEFDVMRMLMQQKEKNLSKEAILQKVWGFDSEAVENHVEVYVGFLRKKLHSIGSNVQIVAARRLGYHLELEG
ncbi:MAG TPA: DNA-binding response regulator [Oribacterium sp.]|nr:DNA-binding response regulator [Oribacterium sp.]HCS67759.1 DNA-binding response regulator [Oribacterium sp.]